MKFWNKKTLKIFLVIEIMIEVGLFFTYPVIKRNFRWNDVLVLEPQWKQDEDYLDRIGLTAKIHAELDKEIREHHEKMEEQEKLKERKREHIEITKIGKQ